MSKILPMETLRSLFGERLVENELLAKYTSARIGGSADAFITARSADELEEVVAKLWSHDVPFRILGGGSNVLVSDKGVSRFVVVMNKAKKVEFDLEGETPTVFAESGTNFGVVARQAGQKSLTGMEWAAGIPGTVGGAVVGNAGAHGGEVSADIKLASVLQHDKGRQEWMPEQFDFSYRHSILKEQKGESVVLSATFQLEHGEPEVITEKMERFLAIRKRTQPPGASMGSMFKNPPGDKAGRLIEAAGLKGTRIGNAEISSQHANFFVNHEGATALDLYKLIQMARQSVKDQFDVELELEISLFGDWEGLKNG